MTSDVISQCLSGKFKILETVYAEVVRDQKKGIPTVSRYALKYLEPKVL